MLFATAVQKAAKEIGIDAVIEVGPHPALAGPIRYVLNVPFSI